MSKSVKSVTKAVSKAVPKIKMDPGKLVSKAVEGATNMQKSIMIDPAVGLAKAAVGGVGEVMSQPGAGAVLGAAGAAFGIPGAGLIAGAFSPSGAPAAPPGYSEPAQPIVINSPASIPGNNNNQMLLIAGGLGLVGILAVVLTMKNKR